MRISTHLFVLSILIGLTARVQASGTSIGDYVNMYQQISGALQAERTAAEESERQADAERQRKEQQKMAEMARVRATQAQAEEERVRRELIELQAQEARMRQIPEYRSDYAGQPCFYFNRPTIEATQSGTRKNIHPEDAWVCHQDVMYQCRDGAWLNRGACSQWGNLKARLALQSHALEGVVAPVPHLKEAKPAPVPATTARPLSDSDNPFR